MTKLLWDQVGERRYETGVDQGVLFIPTNGVYTIGYAWNGLTTVTESPSGAEATPLYADNIKYLNLVSAEEFGCTIEAFTYPDQFAQCDGTAVPQPGVSVGQQSRKQFGLAYRTRVGNDVSGADLGYKIHLVYGATAAPSEKPYATINDTPEAVPFSWEVTTTPVSITGLKPTSILTIDSTKVTAPNLLALENAIYGTAGTDPRLPLPDEVVAMFTGSLTLATPVSPTFTSATGVITIPATTGVDYRRSDTNVIVTGTTTIAGTTGATLIIYATPKPGYYFAGTSDDDWQFTRTA